MSLKTHLESLKQKHRSLEEKLQEALKHASVSDEEIVAIKKQKLAIKEEIRQAEVSL